MTETDQERRRRGITNIRREMRGNFERRALIELLAEEIAKLSPTERRVLEGVEEDGGEVDTEELLELEGEELRVDVAALGHEGGSQPPLEAHSLGGGLVQQPWGQWDWPLTLSAPERAILELLDEVPQRETFHQADMLMEGLRTLSPKRLQKLLVECRSVKVKRLFLWFAERHNHAWLKQLHREEIDLGTGKRMLQRGGKLDPKFNITVPEDLDAGR